MDVVDPLDVVAPEAALVDEDFREAEEGVLLEVVAEVAASEEALVEDEVDSVGGAEEEDLAAGEGVVAAAFEAHDVVHKSLRKISLLFSCLISHSYNWSLERYRLLHIVQTEDLVTI